MTINIFEASDRELAELAKLALDYIRFGEKKEETLKTEPLKSYLEEKCGDVVFMKETMESIAVYDILRECASRWLDGMNKSETKLEWSKDGDDTHKLREVAEILMGEQKSQKCQE